MLYKLFRAQMAPSLPKSSPNTCLIEPLIFLFTGFFQSRLWVSGFRVMQLDTEPSIAQWFSFATNKPHPFLVGSLRTSIRLGQYT